MDIKYLNLQKITESFQPELDEALQRVVRKGWFLGGDETRAFEAEFAAFCGSEHCLGVANGLDALYLALRSLKYLEGWADGDEVIVPAYTFIASVEAVSRAQLTPILCDVREDDFLIDCDRLESLITPRTRAIMPVHLFGKVADMERITALAGRKGLRVVEDCAQAHGALDAGGRRAGASGDVAAFSFYPGKNLGALGDGGALVTRRKDVIDYARMMANYGMSVKYVHDVEGINSRLDELQAAALRVKLRRLDTDNSRRQELARLYETEISNERVVLPTRQDPSGVRSVYHIFPVLCAEREQLQRHLAEGGVQTQIHYPIPPHKQATFAALNRLTFEVAERLAHEQLSLPLNPSMNEEEVKYIIQLINTFVC